MNEVRALMADQRGTMNEERIPRTNELPAHKNIYEKVYTDDRDVVLFWKTHMLYYVKTDRLFNNLEVEVDDRKFYFDASTLEHKRANEKRELVYELTGKRDDGALTFSTAYSEKGRKTKLDDTMRQLHKLGVEVKEDTVERAFRVFERQSEVDYFINKNARAFLREQFDLWMFQYVFSGESEWTEQRIKQLQVLKDIALKDMGFVRSPKEAPNMEGIPLSPRFWGAPRDRATAGLDPSAVASYKCCHGRQHRPRPRTRFPLFEQGRDLALWAYRDPGG